MSRDIELSNVPPLFLSVFPPVHDSVASRPCVRIRTSFPSIVRFSFADELVRPDDAAWRVFLAVEPVYGVNTPRARRRHAKPHTRATGNTKHTERDRRAAVSVVNCVWTVGILRGIFIAPGCPVCRLNNLRVIANSAVRLAVL